jgi:hypothetical protein
MQIDMDYKKISTVFIFTLLMVAGYSQNTISNYKYVLLPQKFDFLSSANEYQLNYTAKNLLEKKGFTVYWTNGDMPQAIAANRCTALTADITQRKALFTTNLTLTLKDCYGNTIFKGKEGRSWEKEFETAFNEALRNAFTSLNAVPYNYDSTKTAQTQQAAASTTAASTTPPTTTSPATTAPVTTPAAAPPATATAPAAIPPVTATATAAAMAQTAAAAQGTLYAQPIANGYQLVDATPKKVLTLLKTSLQDCFLATAVDGIGGSAVGTATATSGIVFKNNDQWFFEYYKDGTLVSQKLTIKF